MTYCPNCGENLPFEAKFCPNCGLRIDDTSKSEDPSSNSSQIIIEEPPKKQNKHSFLDTIKVVIYIFLLFILYFEFSMSDGAERIAVLVIWLIITFLLFKRNIRESMARKRN